MFSVIFFFYSSHAGFTEEFPLLLSMLASVSLTCPMTLLLKSFFYAPPGKQIWLPLLEALFSVSLHVRCLCEWGWGWGRVSYTFPMLVTFIHLMGVRVQGAGTILNSGCPLLYNFNRCVKMWWRC